MRTPFRLALVAGTVLAGVTCTDAPTAPIVPTGSLATLSLAPSFGPEAARAWQSLAAFNIVANNVRVVLKRPGPPEVVLKDTTLAIAPGQMAISIELAVPINGTEEQLGALIQVRDGTQVLFEGTAMVRAVRTGTPGTPPAGSDSGITLAYVGPGAAAAALRIAPRDQAVTTGASVSFSVTATDAAGAPVALPPIEWSLSDPTLGTISSTSGAFTAGTRRGAVVVRVRALSGLSDAVTLAIVPPAERIVTVAGGAQSASAGKAVAEAFVVEVQAADGLPVPNVAVRFSASSGAAITPAEATTDATGRAAATMTVGRTAGSYTFTATAGALGSTSVTATATPAPASTITVVSGSGQSGAVGTPAAQPLVVLVRDEFGGPVAGVDVAWAIASGGGTLGSATTVTDTAGTAQVTYTHGTTPRSVQVTATVTTPAGSQEVSFTLTTTPGRVATLAIVSGNGQVGMPGEVLQPMVVKATDSLGNVVPASAISWTTSGGRLSSPATTTGADGTTSVVLTLGTTAGVVGVFASAPGSGTAPGATASFTATIVAGLAAALAPAAGNAQSAPAGSAVPVRPAVRVTDAYGNPVRRVLVRFAVTSGGGTITGDTATTGAAGLAAVGSWTLGTMPGANTLTASSGPLSTTFTATGTGTAGPPAQLVAVNGPSFTYTAGVTIASWPTVRVLDAAGHGVPDVAIGVSVLDSAGATDTTFTVTTDSTGAAELRPAGTTTLEDAETYTIVATTAALPEVSRSFTVTVLPASVSALVVRTAPSAATLGTALSPAPVVEALDAFGNPVPGVPVAVTIASGGGSFASTSTTTVATGSSGQAAFANLAFQSGSGTQQLVFTSGSVSSASVPVAINTASIVSVAVTPQRDTLTSLGDSHALTAVARDGAGAATSGSFTWVSRNPAVATVDAAGQVTAVANGNAWIVATESGGLRDSALVTVQQRVASVTITPGSRSIYLTRTFQFTASAVDGRGHPIGAPTFAWSSTAPSVATVDSTGLVTALALGTARLRATTGGVTGVASVTIATPILRIVVGRDSAGVPVGDTIALTALGAVRHFRAIAYDTLDAAMTGVSFTWASTNGSVALLDSATATTARATAAANGLTAITATAQGITGSATLRVQQLLSSIELTPASGTIGVTGTLALLARGKDANGRFIPGGSFSYASSNPAVATVDAGSGVVTGVATGAANMTATSGAITSNAAVITVAATVPPRISVGRDTLAVGRGSSTSIPVFLSTPSAAPVTVALSVSDTVAYFSPASVTFPANVTAVNATLYGRNAGTATVVATETTTGGYAPDTAAVAVQATLRFATSSFAMNSTDTRSTQVLLSDPSPAGGTYVTFAFGTPNVATVSPNPAFIPAGQLAADVVITAVATGSSNQSTTITPSAIGVNGSAASVTAYPARLSFSSTTTRLGAGQFQDHYVALPTNNNNAVTVTLTSSDSSAVRVPASVTIPVGSYYSYFRVSSIAPGTSTITMSAPGWTSANSMVVTSTSPRLEVCCGGSLTTTAPARSVTVYATDSVGNSHNRTNSLVVQLRSSDPSILRVLDTVTTIEPGQYYSNAARVAPGGGVGSAWLYATAGGHTGDSTLYTFTGPKLSFSGTLRRLGAGQQETGTYVSTPDNVVAPLALRITSSDSNVVAVTGSLAVPAGSYYAYFLARAKSAGSVTLVVTAPGYEPDTMTFVATSPALSLSGGGTLQAFAPPSTVTVYAVDSTDSAHERTAPLTVTLRSTDPAVVTVDSSASVPAGRYYTSDARVTPVGTGTALVIATAPGHRSDTVSYAVVTPRISISSDAYTVGRRQRSGDQDFYVYTPNNRATPLTVVLTHSARGVIGTTADSLVVPAGSYYAYFGVQGLAFGIDTIISSAVGYTPDTLVVRVNPPRLAVNGISGSATTTNPPFGITVYSTDSTGAARVTLDTVVVRLASTDTTVLKPATAYARIAAGTYYAQPTVNIVGPGSAAIIVSDSAGVYARDTTNTMTVTGPSLRMSSSSVRLGMRQTTGATDMYVYVDNSVSAPLTVNLVSSSSRVVSVPSTVTIPAGSNSAYFRVEALDTLGTIQVQAAASGYNPVNMTVQVTQPRFVISTSTSSYTTGSPRGMTIYATDAQGSTHYTSEPVTVTLVSSAPGVASVDSTTVTIPAGAYYTQHASWRPGTIGTAQLTASDERAAFYKYQPGTVDVSVLTPPLSLSWNTRWLGLGQYDDDAYVSVPDNAASSIPVSFSHRGTARITTVPAGGVTIPTGTYYQYFRVIGSSVGTDTLLASASVPAHLRDSAYTVVSAGRIDPISSWPATLAAGDSAQVTLYARDENQGTHKVVAATTFTLAANANIEFRSGGAAITAITIPADAGQVSFYVKGKAAGTGSATITATNYSTYTNSITVTP
ncbi:MAG: Ig-like domain-containing protein [Gemmatimonadaceae bacterium]